MTTTPTNGTPSVTEIARRLQRVEDKLDERIVTTDMLRATEKVLEAREIGHIAEVTALRERVSKLEASNGRLSFMVVAAFLTLLVQLLVQISTSTGR